MIDAYNYLVFRLAGNENQPASPAQEGSAYILEASLLWEAEVTLMGLNKWDWIKCADLD